MKHVILLNVSAYLMGNVNNIQADLPIIPREGELMIGVERMFDADDFITRQNFEQWVDEYLNPDREFSLYVREVIHYFTSSMMTTHICLDRTDTSHYIKHHE